jgi:hypothetical protein
MQLLQVNPQWKISGSTLRIPRSVLDQRGKVHGWLAELTAEVASLKREKAEKKTKKNKEVGEETSVEA